MNSKREKETPWRRFDRALRTVLSVPKETILKEEEKRKRTRAKRKQTRKYT